MISPAADDTPLIHSIISEIKKKQGENLIAVYGIGSYFDEGLPADWVKNDVDLVAIVKSLEPLEKKTFTDVRYRKFTKEKYDIWIGFNTPEGYQNETEFQKQSFSNYKWSILDLKLSENSRLLYGKDIRKDLPEVQSLEWDFDDLLARGLYHMEKSFAVQKTRRAKRELTKGIFKTSFYLCICLDSSFRKTSIRAIATRLEQFARSGTLPSFFVNAVKECILFRRGKGFRTRYKKLRGRYLLQTYTLLVKGQLHRRMSYRHILRYLHTQFTPFHHLIRFTKDLEKFRR